MVSWSASELPDRDTNFAPGGSGRLGNTVKVLGDLVGGAASEPQAGRSMQSSVSTCRKEGIDGELSSAGALPQAGAALMFPHPAATYPQAPNVDAPGGLRPWPATANGSRSSARRRLPTPSAP